MTIPGPGPHPDDYSLPRYMRWEYRNMFESKAVPRWWARPFARWLRRD